MLGYELAIIYMKSFSSIIKLLAEVTELASLFISFHCYFYSLKIKESHNIQYYGFNFYSILRVFFFKLSHKIN